MASNLNRVVNAGIGYTVGNILIKGIGFLTIPLYTRLMTTGDYGIYNTYIAYVGIVTFFVCLGLDPTLKNAEQDFSKNKDIYLSTIYILTLIATTAFLAFAIIFGNLLEDVFNLNRTIFILMTFNAEAVAVVNIYNIKLSLNYASRNYLKIAFFQTTVGIILSVTLILTVFKKNRYMGRIVGTIIPALCVATMILWKSIKKLPDGFDKKMARYSLKLGLPLVPHLLAQIINSQFDRIMISNLVGYAQSGIYSFTYNIAIILQIIYQSIDNVWSPWFFQKMAHAEYKKVKQISRKYTVLVAFFAVSLMTISNEFIMLFSTKAYWEGRAIVLVLIEGIFFLFLYTIPAGIEYYMKQTRYIALGSVMTAILNVVMNYFCIKSYGYEAAAYTTLISYVILFILHWNIASHLFNVKELFDLKWMAELTVVVMLWGGFCRYAQGMWLVRYTGYLAVLGAVLLYFKEDVFAYIKNLNEAFNKK